MSAGLTTQSPGLRVPPFTTFVIKVYERCNLNCSYCYMYNLADHTYQGKPARMSKMVHDRLFQRLGEHATAHGIDPIVVVIHGGEPLLAGIDYMDGWLTALRRAMDGIAEVRIRLQTNALLIDSDWVELFFHHGIRVGVSLDGPQRYNDRFRLDIRGAGSYARALAGLEHLLDHEHGEHVFGAVLSVADPAIPAREMWDFWRDLGVRRFDFNLPHCTHDNPPWFSIASLSQWLIELFDLWWDLDDPSYEIRFFRNVVSLIMGAPFSTDYLGGRPGGIAVVDTDGAIQGADALRACEDGLVELGLAVASNSFDDALGHPIVQLANHSSAQLSVKCQECLVRDVCGGGYLPHRFSKRHRFDNPSVYCDSLYATISHARERIVAALGPVWKDT